MRINNYQSNALMLRESQRVLHQQYLYDMKKLNLQVDYRKRQQEIKTHWVKPTSVDVYV